MSVDVATFKDHFETDMGDDALQRLIDSEDAEITRRFGSATSVTEQYQLATPNGYGGDSPWTYAGQPQRVGRRHIWTKQVISSITSVKDGPTLADGDLTTLVADTDYRIIHDGRAVERIGVDFDRWVVITYVPESDVKRRDRVTIDLVKLAIQFNGLDRERVGDWSGDHKEYQKEREMILSTLNSGRRHYA